MLQKWRSLLISSRASHTTSDVSRSTVRRSVFFVVYTLFATLSLLSLYIYLYTPAFTQVVNAAPNNTINFQARLLSNTGAVAPDGYYNVEFKLYDAASGGTLLWTDTRYDTNGVTAGNDYRVQVKNGYLTVSLGDATNGGTAFPGSIDWSQEVYLTMNIGGTTQTASPTWNGEMSPRMKVTAVPYAFAASKLKGSTGMFDADQLAQLGPGSVQTVNSANTAIRVNQTGAGALLQFQASGNDRLLLAANGNLTVAGTGIFQGASVTIGTTSQAGVLTLSDGSSNSTTIQAAATSSNLTFTLPAAYGANGECLIGNGAGGLSFSSTCGSGGGGAPVGATYLTLSNDATLTGERVLTAGTNISVSDTGANGTLTVNVASSPTFSGTLTVQGASITVGTTSQQGSVVLNDGSSNTTTLQSAATSSNLTFKLPSGYGGSGDCIVGDGAGNFSFSSTCGTGGSGSAPIGASYLTLGLDGSLTSERVLTAGSNISITDGGANGNLTVNTVNNPSFTGGATIRGLTVDTVTATDDLLVLSVTTGGAGRFTGTITSTDLTGNQTYTLPNATGTILTTGNLSAITATGTIGSGTWQGSVITDTYINDTLTIGSGSTVDWTALNNYPAACGAGTAVTALGDTITCTAFAASSGSANYIQAQGTTPGTAQNTNFNIGTGTGIATTFNATSSILLNGNNINTGGTLSNVAYKDQANSFSAANTFTAANALTLGTTGSNNGGVVFRSSNAGSSTITLQALTTLGATARTITLPDATGTVAVSASGALSLSATTGALTVADAVANGSTKGVASFTAADFNDASGNISIDYTNGQAASGSTKGFLTAADWTTFNGKLAAEADTLQSVTTRGATTTTASSFTGGATIRGLTVDTATATDDRLLLSVTTGGAGRFDGTITSADLTAARTYTLPDATGTFITTGNLSAITATGTITSGTWQGSVIADTYINDTLTIGSGSTVDWTALNNYPAACGAGTAVTALGDTITCTAFAASSGSANYIQAQGTTPGTAQNTNFNIGTGTGIAAVFNATSSILLNGANINTGGTLSNVAYKDQANSFSAVNTFTAANAITLGTTGSNNGGVVFRSSNAGSSTVTLQALTTLGATARTITLPDGSGTVAVSASGALSLSATTGALTVADAVANGSTKGVASFTAADFNDSAGNISIDYTNGQAASGSTKGFLTAADWTTFNGKLAAEADTLQSVTTRGATTTTASSFTGGATIRGLTVDTATATDDRLLLSVTTGGAGRFDGTITSADLTAARTYTLPDATGTILTTGNLSAITATGTIGSGTWQGSVITDTYINDTLTIGSGSTVDWTALNNYPAACGAGTAVTALGDTITCTAFAASSGSANYIQAQGTTPGTAQNTNFNIGTGTGIATTFNATSSILLNGNNINTGGTLSNVAYKDQANSFSAANTFTAANALTLGTTGSNNGGVVFRSSNAGSSTITLQALTTLGATARTITLPDATGTVAVSASGALSLSATTGALTVADAVANGSTKGVASFTAADFNDASGNISIDYTNGQAASGSTKGFLTAADWTTFNGKLAAEADTLQSVTTRGATTTTASSFTGGATIRGLTVDTATATDDRLLLSVTTGGAGRFDGTITSADLTAARTYTLPDATGTILTTGNLSAITATGTIGSGTWQGSVITDTYINDTLTIGSGSTVDWTALNNYPAACGAGTAVTALGDTITCTAFAASSGSANYIQAQGTTPGTAQNTNFNIGTGTGIATTFNATSSILLNGANINTGGTLSNVAYKDQANSFSAVNTFTAANAITLGTTGSNNGGVVFRSSNAGSSTVTLQALTTLGATARTITLPDGSGTVAVSASGALSLSATTGALTVADAVANGSTKGVASFTAADFNDSAGNISIDYTNGQAASGSTKGFLTAADWTTFNGKLAAEADTLQSVTTRGATTTTASSFTGGATIRGLTVDTATATDDRLLLSVTTGGAGRFDGTITSADLTANRSYTLPNAGGTFAVSASTPLTLNATTGNLTIADAAANGSTKGAASFATNDFDATSGNISLDYANGQAASGSAKGFLTSADWTTFNGKLSAEADTLQSVIARGATATSAATFNGGASIRGLTVDNATAADDRILITSAALGSGTRFDGTITNANLTAARTYTLQDNSGIIPLATAANSLFFTTSGATSLTLPTTGTVCTTATCLTSFSEADTLQSVTTRGATTTTASSFTNTLGVSSNSASTALTVTSSSTGNGLDLALTNTTGTQTNGLYINRNGAGGTTTSLLNLTNTAGTATNGIIFNGTIGTDITTAAARNLNIITGTTGQLALDTGSTGAINIGTNANAKTVTIGNTTSTSIVNIQGGTGTAAGDINIGDTTVAGKIIDIGSVTNAATSTIRIATAAAVQTVTVGSTNSTSTTTINGGVNGTTPTISLQAATNGYIALGTTNANTIQIGAVGTTANATTVNIANTTGAAVQTVNIGSTSTTSTTTIQAGSGNINLQNTVAIGTLSTTAGSLRLFDANGQYTQLQAGDSAGNLSFTLPTTIGSASQCLMNSGTAGVLTFGGCSTATLQDVYNNSSAPATITTTATNKGVLLKAGVGFDSASLFQIQNAGGTSVFNVNTAANGVSITSAAPITGYSQDFNGSFLPAGWTTGGNANWTQDSTTKQEGASSANSGVILDNQSSWIDYDYTAPADGTLTFWWKVSSENNYDYLSFCLDNDSCTRTSGFNQQIAGTVDWTQVSVPITAGSHSFRFLYAKDSSSIGGTDESWVDNIVFTPGAVKTFKITNNSQTLDLFTVDSSGSTKIQNSTNNTSAFTVQNSSSGNIFNVDSLNSSVSVGSSSLLSNLFASKVDYATLSNPFASTYSDIDKDGDNDLITSSGASSGVMVSKNNGDGTFAAAVGYATVADSRGVIAVDINKDSWPDVIASNSVGGATVMSVFINNGNGTLAAKVDYTTGSDPYGLGYGDFDKDGDIDIVATNFSSNNMSIMKNNGNGTFAAKVDYATGNNPYSSYIGDLNGDNYIDIAISNYGSTSVSVFTNNGNGTFAAKVDYSVGSSPTIIDGADFDGDGDIDLTTSNSGSYSISVLINTGSGQYSTAKSYSAGSETYGVATGDFDKDGDVDIAGINRSSNNITMLINRGNAEFVYGQSLSTGTNPLSIVSADFDKDGDNDLIGVNNGSGNVSVLLNTSLAVSPVSSPSLTVFNSGFKDALSIKGYSDENILRVDGQGNTTIGGTAGVGLGLFAQKTGYSVGSNPRYVTASDFDKDGDNDMVVANWGTSSISVFMNNGNGTFAAKVDYTTGSGPVSISTADFDKDGDVDLVVANRNGTSISVFMNNGNGTFAAKVDYTTGSGPQSVATADFDKDNDIDIVVTNNNTTTVSVFMNNGSGTFAAKVDYTVATTPDTVIAYDFDKDGDSDLAVTNSGSNTVSVLLNNGNGTFAAKVDYATGSTPYSLKADDIDKDGDIDLLTGNYGSNTVSVLLNNGNGTFATKVDYFVSSSPQSISTADFDKDGDIDLAVAGYQSTLSLFMNNGNGTFASQVDYPVSSNAYSVTVADFDSDSDIDVAVTTLDSKVSVFLNNTISNSRFKIFDTSGATSLLSIDASGSTIIQSTQNTQQALTVQNSSNNNALTVDTFNRSTILGSKDDTIYGDETAYVDDGGYPEHVMSTDLNKDGKKDIVVILDTVSVYINKGDGSFLPKVSYTAGTNPTRATYGDFDRDGDIDIAVSNQTSNTVSIFLNNGSGGLTLSSSPATATTPYNVKAADFDKDGDIDLVTANYNSSSVSILLGNGNGLFAAKVDYTTLANPNDVVVADIDKDGDNDVVVSLGSGSGGLSVLKNNGNGTFATKVDYSFPSSARGLEAADYDGDGDIDIAIHAVDELKVYYNNGSGTFSGERRFFSEYPAISLGYIKKTVDYDTDGDLDIVYIGDDYLALGTNNSTGNFTFKKIYDHVDLGAFDFADYDNDTDLDLAFVSDYGVEKLTIVENISLNVSPIDTPASLTVYTTRTQDSLRILSASGENNFRIDAKGGTTIGGNNGSIANLFSYPEFAKTNANGVRNMTSADFDKDGDIDIAGASESSNNIVIMNNDGNGNYSYNAVYTTNTSPYDIANGDFDKDGDIDIAVPNYTSGNVSVFLNSGTGTFAAKVDYTVNTNPESIVIADFDKDGDDDIAIANDGSNNMSVLLSNGNGTFAAKVDYTTATNPSSVASKDIDKDGDIDLVVANQGSASASVFLNNGNGTFAAKVDYTTASGPVNVSLGDVDGDGDMDMITANGSSSNSLSILKNNGNGTFAAKADISMTPYTYPANILSSDFDKDGDIDLITHTTYPSAQLIILSNDGTGSFTEYRKSVPNTASKLTAMADIDFDGDIDLVGSTWASPSSLTLFENTLLSSDRFTVINSGGDNKVLTVSDSGVGIGSGSNPGTYSLDVYTDKTGYAMRIQNASAATVAGTPASSSDGLLIQIGTANASRTTGNYFVAFADGTGTVAGKIQGGASAVAYTTTGADYAEYFRAPETDMPLAGELVALDSTEDKAVVRAGNNNQVPLAGIVSTNPGFIGNGPLCQQDDKDCDTNYAKYNALVALNGQVPTKVNTSNGPIARGDPITVSAVAGEGAKATGSGYIVGYAMESLANGSGTIQVLVRPQYHTVNTAQELQGSGLNITGNATLSGDVVVGGNTTIAGNLNVSGPTTLTNLTVNGGVTINGNLTVENITVANITINGHIITAGNTPTTTIGTAAGTEDITNNIPAPQVTIEGNDTSGTITIVAGANTTNGTLAEVSFNQAFGKVPKIVVTGQDMDSAGVAVFATPTANGFTFGTPQTAQPNKTYRYSYFVIE